MPEQLARFVLAIAAALAAPTVAAQTPEPFPSKAVRIIVAFPPGGGTDIVARVLGQKLSEAWGQPVVVENRAGAAGIIGTELAAKSPADGYTLFMGTLGNLAVNQHLYPKMTVDPQKDFAPLTQVVAVNFVMVAHPSLPANGVPELIALAAARPGQINYASSGAGGAPHLAAELFQNMAKVKMVHVAYKGSGPSFNDLLAGQVTLTCDSLVQALPYIRAGRLKALAVLGAKRTPLLPDVPTVGETVPGFELTNWFGLVVPVGTPPDRIAKLYADVAKALPQKEVGEKFTEMGADPVGSPPAEFGAFMKAESAKWARLIKEANIRAE
jgi:tripartite-type tricarboxylate transporter receptor subunit TctC